MKRQIRKLTKGEALALEMLSNWLEHDESQSLPMEICRRMRVIFQDTPIANFRIEEEIE